MNIEQFNFLGQGSLFAIQQVLLIVAAVIAVVTMVVEIGGRTFKGFSLVPNLVRWDARSVATAAIVGAISVALQPLQIVLIPGISGISPSKALAPIFSVLFGVPGMVGAAFSMPFQDLVGGWFGISSSGGFLFTWLALCWLPYKMVRDPSFRNMNSALGYYWIAAILSPVIYSLLIANTLGFFKLMAPEAAFGILIPTIMWNHGLTALVIAPALLVPLFPRVQAWGLYWRDRVATTAGPAEMND